jgi:peptidyl-dipeptidase Dcp
VLRLAEIRGETARLLGYRDYAAWALQDQMARTPAAVDEFLGRLIPPAIARARVEAGDLQALIDRQRGGFALEAWDWPFYAEQIRKATYDLDEAQIKPYFELNRVLVDGVFYAAEQLYGLTFSERHDLPVYHPDVRVFEVRDARAALGLLYVDMFARDNKAGGAWMDNYVGQSSLLGERPVICNVANFVKPAPGQPALLSADDVTTMFHEFGHALHGLLSNGRYPSLSGTSVARDFVELPSQFNEYWALEPSVLSHYAVHHETGARMPDTLVETIRRARDFNAGYDMTELLAAAELDMQWHTLDASERVADVDAFETSVLAETGLHLPQVPSRYRSSYFLHIWANGYAAGYYAYLWSRMLADDAFAWFEAHGGLTRENGDRFRATILSRGNGADYAQMYRDLTGRDPDIAPMLKYRGLAGQ